VSYGLFSNNIILYFSFTLSKKLATSEFYSFISSILSLKSYGASESSILVNKIERWSPKEKSFNPTFDA